MPIDDPKNIGAYSIHFHDVLEELLAAGVDARVHLSTSRERAQAVIERRKWIAFFKAARRSYRYSRRLEPLGTRTRLERLGPLGFKLWAILTDQPDRPEVALHAALAKVTSSRF